MSSLGRIGDARAVESIADVLEEDGRGAIEALGMIEGPEATVVLIRALGHINQSVGASTQRVLENRGKSTVSLLVQALGDLDRDVRNGAIQVLKARAHL